MTAALEEKKNIHDNAGRWLHVNNLEATESGWSDIQEGTVPSISPYGGD